jgi:hypothetical protein
MRQETLVILVVIGIGHCNYTHERGIPSKRESSPSVDYVPALCTHRPSLLPIEWFSEVFGLSLGVFLRDANKFEKMTKLDHLEEVKVVTRFP